ncbi:MAG: ATP-binding protein [Bdellovibrionaceae bacterium]|nr:ATP-binding protein [Pseudobdellovibrionaceae bacterium]
MILHSFVRGPFGLSVVEVEVLLQRGLPKIEILGLPDRGLQESSTRIQSAIASQGFQFPKAQRVVVNIRPLDVRKSSNGLELAIALAILHLTGQKSFPEGGPYFIYGELSLAGEVYVPKDIELLPKMKNTLLTGHSPDAQIPPIGTYCSLSALKEELQWRESFSNVSWVRPMPKVNTVPESVARLLALTTVGEHSLLMAGPSGSGKTTLAENIKTFLRQPSEEQKWDIRRNGRLFGETRTWRPEMVPHHSISVSSMLGGGNLAAPGAIVKAHHGVLVLDELLEFHQEIQAALREPTEKKTITISKNTKHHTYDAHFLLIGATNLCRCGAFVPEQNNRCRCSSIELRKYIDKLSGPLLDRFTLFSLTHEWRQKSEKMVSMEEVGIQIQAAQDFADQRNNGCNEFLSESDLLQQLVNKSDRDYFPEFASWRRYLSFLRVARTFADLEQSQSIQNKHLLESYQLTNQNHQRLEKMSFFF